MIVFLSFFCFSTVDSPLPQLRDILNTTVIWYVLIQLVSQSHPMLQNCIHSSVSSIIVVYLLPRHGQTIVVHVFGILGKMHCMYILNNIECIHLSHLSS